MKKPLIAAVVMSFAVLSQGAQAAGCLSGAAVGGVGGHFAGHHGLLGAAAGCAVGHHVAKKQARANAAQTNATRGTEPAPTRSATAGSTSTYAPTR